MKYKHLLNIVRYCEQVTHPSQPEINLSISLLNEIWLIFKTQYQSYTASYGRETGSATAASSLYRVYKGSAYRNPAPLLIINMNIMLICPNLIEIKQSYPLFNHSLRIGWLTVII